MSRLQLAINVTDLDAAIALGALLVVAAAFVGDRLLRAPGSTP